MITSILLKNISFHKDSKISFGNLTFFVGPNLTGKTSVLNLLCNLKDTSTKFIPEGIFFEKDKNNKSLITIKSNIYTYRWKIKECPSTKDIFLVPEKEIKEGIPRMTFTDICTTDTLNILKDTPSKEGFYCPISFNVHTLPNQISDWVEYILGAKCYQDSAIGKRLRDIISNILVKGNSSTYIILKNPEEKLHCNAQSRLMEFIALAISLGANIVIETQSDHIINGTMVQCCRFRKTGKGIEQSKLKINFFERISSSQSVVIELAIDEDESIDRRLGFFDQFDQDLNYLIGLKEFV